MHHATTDSAHHPLCLVIVGHGAGDCIVGSRAGWQGVLGEAAGRPAGAPQIRVVARKRYGKDIAPLGFLPLLWLPLPSCALPFFMVPLGRFSPGVSDRACFLQGFLIPSMASPEKAPSVFSLSTLYDTFIGYLFCYQRRILIFRFSGAFGVKLRENRA